MRLHAASDNPAADQFLAANCLATDAVGDAVRVSADKVGDFYQATKTNIDSIPTMPGVGIIIEKSSNTECIIQTAGVVRDVYTGLTFHKRLFIDTNSRLIEGPPPRPTSGFRAIQEMGVVLSSTELLLNVKSPIILRA